MENDENRFFAITSSKLVTNWFCKKHLLRNDICHNYLIFVFFAQICHKKSVKKNHFQHQNWGPKHNFCCLNLFLNVNSYQKISKFISLYYNIYNYIYWSLNVIFRCLKKLPSVMDKACVSYGQINFFFNPLYQGNRKTFLSSFVPITLWKYDF